MSKELEALERLYCAGRLDLDYVSSPKHKEDYNLIEKALEKYEELKEMYEEVCKSNSALDKKVLELNKKAKALKSQVVGLEIAYDKLADKFEKYYKALEIIKREPSVVIEIITTYDTWEEYTNDYPLSDKTIWHIIKNKSEFDLLKEIFK